MRFSQAPSNADAVGQGPLLENCCFRLKGLLESLGKNLIQGESGKPSHYDLWERGFIVRIRADTVMGVEGRGEAERGSDGPETMST